MKLLRWALPLSAVTMALAGLALALGAALPADGQIAFYSSRDGNLEIYLADVAHGIQRNLTRHPADDLSPAWSPDGEQIAFVSSRGGSLDIYVMDARGGNLRRLTDTLTSDVRPVWSPDGTRIAYQSYRDNSREIFLVSLADAVSSRLTYRDGNYSLNPVWSPDGARIVYYADDRRDPELFVANLVTRTTTRLTSNRVNDWEPVWSPDGAWLTFYANPDGNIDLYALDTACIDSARGCDGAERRLTAAPDRDWLPSWSPDGARLAFLSERGGSPDVHVIAAACLTALEGCDADVVAVGAGEVADEPPVWSPDGTRLAFVSRRDGNMEIYVAYFDCADCSPRLQRVTVNDGRDRAPAWRPSGS